MIALQYSGVVGREYRDEQETRCCLQNDALDDARGERIQKVRISLNTETTSGRWVRSWLILGSKLYL